MLSNTGNLLITASAFSTLLIIYSSYHTLRSKNYSISKNLVYLNLFQITFAQFLSKLKDNHLFENQGVAKTRSFGLVHEP